MQVYHPNIDFDGNVCLNVLKDQWRPVLEISQIIHGLNFLFVVRYCDMLEYSRIFEPHLGVHRLRTRAKVFVGGELRQGPEYGGVGAFKRVLGGKWVLEKPHQCTREPLV